MIDWIYARNPFLLASENSFVNALALSLHHDVALNALKADAFVLKLYNAYHPLHVALDDHYVDWTTQMAAQQGDTINLQQMLHALSNQKIKQWDVQIQNVYRQDSVEYMKLLPYRRTPFHKGAQRDRLSSVRVLSLAIGTDVALAKVKADVDSFSAKLDAAFETQKKSIAETKLFAEKLNDSRIVVCKAQFANLGAIMQHYVNTPEQIPAFFNQAVLRRTAQTSFTRHVKVGQVCTVVKHTFAATDEVFLHNKGVAALHFYLAQSKNKHPEAHIFILEPGEKTVLASALGDINNKYVTVLNPDKNNVGWFELSWD